MIKLYNSNITDILPEAIASKPEVISIGYAIEKAMQRFLEYCRNTSVYAIIDIARDNVLDMLALELGTQYYDDSLDIATKRRLVKNSLIWYMTSGTPAAVEELVAAVFGEGEVKEWFEYGDDPYYFKVITNAIMTPEINDEFLSMLEKVKNARSHIRSIEIIRTTEQNAIIGYGCYSIYKPQAIMPGLTLYRTATENVYMGMHTMEAMRSAPIVEYEAES